MTDASNFPHGAFHYLDQFQHRNPEIHSPFILKIPSADFLQSSIGGISPVHEGQETLERDVLGGRILNTEVEDFNVKSRHGNSRTRRKSRYGITCPSIPSTISKKIASRFLNATAHRRSNVSKQILQAILEAGDLYFEQLSQDLATFCKHAARKKIDESDVIAITER